MSYVVGTGMAAFCHGEDHPRGVPVAARACPQDSHRKVRSASPGRSLFLAKHSEQVIVVQAGGTSTTFRPARWPHPVSSRFAAPIAASAALRAIVDLARNMRPEVRHGDHLVAGHDPPGPDAGRVGVLPGGLLLQLRRLAPGPPVPAGWGLPALAPPAGHLPLGPGQFGGAAFPVTAVRQVIGGIGGGGGGSDTPVNADRAVGFWRWRWVAGDDERGVPVAQAVLVDADAGRFGRQFPGPDDRDGHAFSQDQPAARTQKPRVVYSSDGSVSLRRFTTGLRRPLTVCEWSRAAA